MEPGRKLRTPSAARQTVLHKTFIASFPLSPDMQDFKKLEVWQLALRLALDVYRACDRRFSRFPGLRAQTLRAAQSISSNIAEGSGSEGAEFARYLGMSLKSTKELENDLIFARDLGALTGENFEELDGQVDRVRRKLIALIRRIRDS